MYDVSRDVILNVFRNFDAEVTEMREATTHPAVRKAIRSAHDERGAALRGAFEWLFPSKTSR